MKKTAVLLYSSFCNFEFSVALELLALCEKEITTFAISREPIRSEEGLTAIADKTIWELNIEEYDSLILTGAADIGSALEDENIISFIRQFDAHKMVIGAISIAPVLLLKAGILTGKPFLAGINPDELLEWGFTEADMANMIGWDANIESPVKDGYIISENIITSVSYNFVKWALAFGKMVGIEINPETFGV